MPYTKEFRERSIIGVNVWNNMINDTSGAEEQPFQTDKGIWRSIIFLPVKIPCHVSFFGKFRVNTTPKRQAELRIHRLV
jgi:hypothetical protein